MPKKASVSAPQPWEVEFVVCELYTQHKEQLKKGWDSKYAITIERIDSLILDGYKLSVWGDKAHDSIGATLTEPASPDRPRKRAISARGKSYLEALRVLIYKHVIILDGNWDNARSNEPNFDGWA